MVKKIRIKKSDFTKKQNNDETAKRVTISKSLATYQTYLKDTQKAEGTIEVYSRGINQFITFLNNQRNTDVRYIDEIKRVNIRNYKKFLLVKNSKGEYKTNTVKSKIASLRAFFRFLNLYYGAINIMKDMDKLECLKDDSKKIIDNYLLDHDIDKLFKYLDEQKDKKGYRDRAMMYLLYYTGCKRSEMLNIKWTDVNMIEKKVKINSRKTSNKNEIILHEKVINEIKKYAEIYGIKSDYVFPNPSDMTKPFDGNTFYYEFKKILKRAGISRVSLSPYSIRHTFIIKCKKAGIYDATIIDSTGHADERGLKPYTFISIGFGQRNKVFDALDNGRVA